MSIFQSKEWWGVKVAPDEEFDERHLWIENIDAAPNGQEKIIVASFSGRLRIYEPLAGGFKIEHLLFEQDLGNPIMQVTGGNFRKSNEPSLCVLFFKRLVFYSFSASNVGGLQAKVLKEHKLERNAFNMCVGQFGGSRQDLVCVQSCDSMLMIFELEQFQCMCQLSTEYFALPGALCYNQQIDAFLIQNSAYELECYKYSNIVAVAQTQLKDSKRPLPDWTLNLGEQAQKMQTVKRSASQSDTVVITEQLMFVINQNGTIRNQKRFDYSPATFVVNDFQENRDVVVDASQDKLKSLFIVIASFTHHLLVYQDFQLLWAAKTDHVCHGIQIGKFNGQRGFITILNDEGWLQVLYLGTGVPEITQELQTSSKMTFPEMEQQYGRILDKIAVKEGNAQETVQEKVNFDLQTEVTPARPYNGYVESSQKYHKVNNKVLEVVLTISLNVSHSIKDLRLSFEGDIGTYVIPNSFEQSDFYPGSPNPLVKVSVYASSQSQPLETRIKIISHYILKQGSKSTVYCSQKFVQIPFPLYATLLPPQKTAEYKITLTLAQQLTLFKMFEDLIQLQQAIDPKAAECLSNPSALTLRICNGKEVTVLVSKNLDKWRVQSNDFETILLLLDTIIERVEEQGSQVQFTDSIPMADIFAVLDDHHNLRLQRQQNEKDLESKAIEFRSIQKKLLSRFKEKNPSSSESLNVLLQVSFEQLMIMIDNAQKVKEQLEASDHQLFLVTKIMVILMKVRFAMTPQAYSQVADLFPYYRFDGEIGWEEVVYGNINHLLRVKMNKQQTEGGQTLQYSVVEDTTKVKKIISILMDKVSKGLFS